MRFILAACALALTAACTFTAQTADAGCTIAAANTWQAGETAFTIEGVTTGPDCEQAVATLIIRNAEGAAIYAEAHITEEIMTLAPAHDVAAMRTALAEWIDPANNTTMLSTSALPEWPEDADMPASGEFPFYPAEGYDRETYTALRAANLPLYCYVQGMESLACLSYGDNGIEKIGVQAFPG
jgi:ABC-type Fe3+-hydroxamate transport system substrate-binding protein